MLTTYARKRIYIRAAVYSAAADLLFEFSAIMALFLSHQFVLTFERRRRHVPRPRNIAPRVPSADVDAAAAAADVALKYYCTVAIATLAEATSKLTVV